MALSVFIGFKREWPCPCLVFRMRLYGSGNLAQAINVDYDIRYMQPLISNVPIMVIEGNHEIEEQAGNKTFVAYSSRFAFPSKESRSGSTLYYSFNAGGVHFIMLGAYISYNKSGNSFFIVFSCSPLYDEYYLFELICFENTTIVYSHA